jgi:hypothetical protein
MPRPSGPVFTGNVRHRVGWRGKLILQVEVNENTQPDVIDGSTQRYMVWRDAKDTDIYGLNWARREADRPPINSPPSPRKK